MPSGEAEAEGGRVATSRCFIVATSIRSTTLAKLIVATSIRSTTLAKLIVASEVRGTTHAKLIVSYLPTSLPPYLPPYLPTDPKRFFDFSETLHSCYLG